MADATHSGYHLERNGAAMMRHWPLFGFLMSLGLVGLGLFSLPQQPPLVAAQIAVPCQAGEVRFTSAFPPALPGEWTGERGFFAIPGVLELSYCQPGRLILKARGELSSNGGAPLLIAQTTQTRREVLVHTSQTLSIPVGQDGRVTLAFPNDETDALYRILTIERLILAGEQRCASALIRDKRVEFSGSITGAVHDLRGQRLEPCMPGVLYLTVSGPVVNGAGPQFRITQGKRTLLDRQVRGRVSLRLPLESTAAVHLAVTNFAGRVVKYRNLFIERVQFLPASNASLK
ncbi:hypothetical protein GO986_14520 [Deinococcus sp. HMF7620]|uniref:Uncharacterized protein n=1 Tax=Deinococcus arboris TaxID=2682977 RepID=A0A7C9HZL3_9DEIO|nr:hypothetical protein [Deinococcus arboris]MVN87970.1 hypothetical protein [Deinococcus arboris]